MPACNVGSLLHIRYIARLPYRYGTMKLSHAAPCTRATLFAPNATFGRHFSTVWPLSCRTIEVIAGCLDRLQPAFRVSGAVSARIWNCQMKSEWPTGSAKAKYAWFDVGAAL